MDGKVKKWGNSLAIRIPKELAVRYDLKNEADVSFVIENDGIKIKLKKQPTLEELLSKITPENQQELIDWGKPSGNEPW